MVPALECRGAGRTKGLAVTSRPLARDLPRSLGQGPFDEIHLVCYILGLPKQVWRHFFIT